MKSKNIIITESQFNNIIDNKYVKKYSLSYINMIIAQLEMTNGSGLPKNKTIFNILNNVKKRDGYITQRENDFLQYVLKYGFDFEHYIKNNKNA